MARVLRLTGDARSGIAAAAARTRMPGEEEEGLPERNASHGTRTLQVSLEEVARLGADYLVTDWGFPWAAADLLAHLRRTAPERLTLDVYLRYPNSTQEGAIYQLTPRGGFLLLYRIERWRLRGLGG